MLTAYFKDPKTLIQYRQGPAGQDMEAFITWLKELGYCRDSIRRSICAAHHFSLWAESTGLTISQCDSIALTTFSKHLQRHNQLKYPGGNHTRTFVGAHHFIDFLAETDRLAHPDPALSTPSEPALLATFRHWMHIQRGTLDSTLDNYQPTLLDLLQTLGDQPDHYDAHALRAFVLDRASRHGLGKAKTVVTAVRMFLRFLIAMGQCIVGLDHAIPTIAHWRLASLPKYLSIEAVERVIASCNLSLPIGVRDKAILLLLARLGLRAGDVAGLMVSAIDWQAGTVLVAGKNRHECRLPLPQDVGDAILDYLKQRPIVNDAHVFITAVAPIKCLSYHAVGQIVTRAIHRTGIQSPVHGAHILRHSAATGMLRQGVSLPAIGVMLRHASIETTAIYAKVDVQLLRQVARPWPEVTSC